MLMYHYAGADWTDVFDASKKVYAIRFNHNQYVVFKAYGGVLRHCYTYREAQSWIEKQHVEGK